MAAKLKVYSGLIVTGKGQLRYAVATTSWAKAAEAAGPGHTVGYLREYWAISANPTTIAKAMEKPGELVEVAKW